MLDHAFFDRDACAVARDLLGKVIHVKYGRLWLKARITEAEAYYRREKASHSSLGYTEKRRAMFMPAGTIYMYYARGGDSLNVSCRGAGDAVLIKSGIAVGDERELRTMRRLNPVNGRVRPVEKLCAGQTLLCRALNLKVPDWNGRQFDPARFYIADIGYLPHQIIQTVRRGIPEGRDGHLPYRFVEVNV